MLKLKQVSKKYGKQLVLDDINLEFLKSEGVYGLLGRNGVGKTTMMKMIVNQLVTFEGEIEFEGVNLKNQDINQIIYVGGKPYEGNSLFQGKLMTLLKEYQRMYKSFDLDFALNLLKDFDISTKTTFKKLSTGNKTIVQNIIGLAARTKITILDEPTNGLDSVNRQKFFRAMMKDYEEYPRMFILSTHLIQEVENYLSHVVMLKDAKVLLDESLEVVQSKAYRIKNADVMNKKVIAKESLGGFSSVDIYDDLSFEEQVAIKQQGGIIEHLNLQSLFNDLMEG